MPLGGDGKNAEPYLNPEYLRGRSSAVMARARTDSVRAHSGDTVLLWDGSNAGEFFRAKVGLVASTMARISQVGSFRSDYFFHALKNSEHYLRSQTNGTGIPHVDREVLESITLFCPDSEVQGVVATVLDTLDTAIHETEALIAKLKAVKQGLLHDLLTRGIDADGELRAPQSEAPHLYKPSPLGLIPTDWDTKCISELLADLDPPMRSGPFGSALLKHELVDDGFPLLGIDNVHTERFASDYARFVTPMKFAQLARYAVRPDDLMITIMGTVGRCCLVPGDIGHALSSKHTWTITLDRDAYSPYLAMLQINYSPWVLAHFARDQQGGTMAAIRSDTLRSTLLPVPPREEQRLMEQRLRTLSERIESEATSLIKHRAEKAGLMDHLLTGRVRVTPLLGAANE
ncbi:restriction endonuclease subunit S [Xanthomonas arboricola]|uniref:restriction endonuclease subunit S n=1 Tax=Xanthomonas arboricola TaxID=56448 RepID=UPI000CACB715|nr:restriction endonuclease subunit S [Xanthomonas arboricola]SOU08414.1 hypothetical protein LMG19144_03501 [Xanthomonas arboricola pv. fragariae]